MRIYSYIESTKALGPYDRFALWTQGCPFSCDGCMTPDSQNFTGGEEITVESIADLILSSKNIEGITITGGEPFMQPNQLTLLIETIKKQRDFGVIIYTGFTLEQLRNKNNKDIESLLNLTDVLIDGVYEKSLNDDIKSLVGSSNQQIYQLTSRYTNIFEQYYHKNQRDIEIHMNDNEIMVVGIPKKATLHKILESQQFCIQKS